MSYTQVRDILDHAQKLRTLVRLYTEVGRADSEDEMLGALLKRCEQRESFMQQCLEQYEADTAQGILDTWIQYDEIRSLDKEFAELEIAPDEEPSKEAIDKLFALDERLLSLYRLAKEQSNSAKVQAFFQDLILMEEQKARAMGWDAVESQDIRPT